MTPAAPRGPLPSRILGLYALAVMEREGDLYGYALADRIAERTDGSWRPGPGAVYPALDSLVRRRLARSSVRGRRRIYRSTPSGRSFLREVRRRMQARARGGPDLGPLWAEIAGADDPGPFLLDRLRTQLDGMVRLLARRGPDTPGVEELRRAVRSELEVAIARLGSRVGRARRRGAAR